MAGGGGAWALPEARLWLLRDSGRPTHVVKALSSPAAEEPFLDPFGFVFWKP